MNRYFLLWVLPVYVTFSGCCTPVQVESTSADPSLDLVYYSDYFSFVGRDAQGYTAFAIDNNRGKDGDRYQAEHFIILHDEQEGWVKLLGNGKYDNRNEELKKIPDSLYFKFNGSAAKGFVINSSENRLSLKVETLITRITRSGKEGAYEMGSSNAVLEWKDRTIRGRVIYEYLYKPGFNRLTRGAIGTFKNFQGLYLMVNDSGDLYFHHRGGKTSTISLNQDGFLVLNGQSNTLPFAEVTASKYQQGFGFYRWPMGWQGRIHLGEKRSSINLDIHEFKVIKNWVIGGFAMGIVHGTLKVAEKQYSLYGFAELII